jgi:hypothetical protein
MVVVVLFDVHLVDKRSPPALHALTRRHLRAALDELDPERPAALARYPVCGVTGLAERIDRHDCRQGDCR